MVGTAVAFITGFKNNASYDRLWEARQIYGAIVNSSRSWGIMVVDFVTPKHAQNTHDGERCRIARRFDASAHRLAACPAFPVARSPRAWEHMIKVYNREYRQGYTGG